MCLMSTELIRLYMFLGRQNLHTKPVDACIPIKPIKSAVHVPSRVKISTGRPEEGRNLRTPIPMSTPLYSSR